MKNNILNIGNANENENNNNDNNDYCEYVNTTKYLENISKNE